MKIRISLNITFKRKRLAKTFSSQSELQKAYGKQGAKKILVRLNLLKEAKNLALVPTTPPSRRHLLRGDRSGQFAVDLVHPYRLVFEPNHDPLILTDDGGIDVTQVTAITITEVIDYH